MENKIGVLFVCTANICRSPTAEAVFRSKATRAGVVDHFEIDSAATRDYRIGKAPDARAQLVAGKRGYEMAEFCARQIELIDLERFDYILAMDLKNLTVLHQLAGPKLWQKPKLLLTYSDLYKKKEIPDPYGKGEEHFEAVLDMIENGTSGLLASIIKKHGLTAQG